jgi:uncharacterized membrane protein (DUF2068 family)
MPSTKVRHVRYASRRGVPGDGKRPLGIAVISVLGFIAAISLICSGVFVLLFAEFGANFIKGAMDNLIPMFGMFLTVIVGAIGVILVILGVLTALISYGLWKMKRWGWIVGMIMLGIGVLTDLGSAVVSPVPSTISIVVEGVILYYLWTNRELFK